MSLHEKSRFSLNGEWLRKQRSAAARYAFAFILTGLSAILGLWLRPATYQVPYLVFYAAILLSVLYGGFRPGLASTIFSALLVNHFFQPPYGEFSYDPQNVSRGVYFSLSFGIICWLIDSRWRRAGSQIETQLQLLDIAVDPILMCDEGDRILYWNKGSEVVYGWSREEAIGKRTSDFLHTVYPKPLEEIKTLLLSEGHWRGEVLRTRKDGSPVVIASSWTLRATSRTSFIRLESGHDITEQRKVEERLREREDHYRDLVENSSDLICTHSLDGRLLFVNELSAKILGYSREEMLGKPMRDFLLPEARAQFDAALLTIQKEGFLKGKMVILTKTGVRRIWEYHNTLRSDGVAVPSVRGMAHDITEQKQAEVALRDSETRLRLALESAGMGTFDWDMVADKIVWSVRHEALFGFGPGTFDGTYRAFTERIHPDDLADLEAAVTRCETHRTPYSHELRVLWPDGSLHWMLSCGEFSFDNDGHATRLRGVVMEITDRKRAEQALRENEARLRLSVQAGNIGLWDWNLATNEVYFSSEWKRQIGYAEGEISNRFEEWQSRVHPDELEPTLQIVKAFIANPQCRYDLEYRFRHKDGSYRWINSQADLLRDPTGTPLRMVGCHLDISERKLAEEALRKSEEKFRLLFEQAPDGIYITDAQGHYLDVNLAGAEVLGYSQEEMRGMQISDVIAPEEFERLAPEIARLAYGEVVTSEWNFKRKDGAIHLGEAVVRQLPDGRLQAIMRNIADRKKAEEALRIQTEELRSLSVRLQKTREEERTLVARDLHDEIGQVLTGLKLDMSWIARRLPEDSQELREKIESTLTLANTGMGWVRKICTQLRPGILDDLGLAAAIEWQAKEFEGRTAIHCNVSLPAGNVDLDQERSTAVFRIFQEALTNVSRHSKATQVEVSLREENEAILLAIRDNGIGMQTSPGQPGRSFGLLGMRERALVFGGKVEFSGAGGGTTVTVSIPHPRLALVSIKNKGKDANSDRR